MLHLVYCCLVSHKNVWIVYINIFLFTITSVMFYILFPLKLGEHVFPLLPQKNKLM